MLRTSILISLLSAIILTPISARALVFAGDLPIQSAEDIEIVDGLAYVVSRHLPGSGIPTLRILDLSDPSTPVEIGSLDTSVGAQDVEVVGGLAYITDNAIAGSLRIIDVSDPTAPVEIGTFASEFEPIDVEVVGNFAYLADQLFLPRAGCEFLCGSAFRVIDVSNPAAPVQVSERFLPLTNGIEAGEGVVYILGRDLEVVNVSNPEMPVTVGVVPSTFVHDIALVEEHVYTISSVIKRDPLTGERYGLEVLNVMDPTSAFSVGRELATGKSIEVIGGFAYIGEPGLKVVDVSDPAAPTRRGSIYSEGLRDLAAYGGHAYLATYDGLKVVDLSVLDTPVEVGSAVVADPSGFDGVANDVVVSDGVAYLAVGDARGRSPARGLRIFDVTDPTAPVAVGGIDTADAALDVELEGELAYVAAESDGLRIFDVTTPSAPIPAGGLALPGSTAKLVVVGEIAYVVDRGIRSEAPVALRLVDVSEPSAPAELSAVELATPAFRCGAPGIAVVEKIAYVTCSGLYILDVSDPAQPMLIFSDRMSLWDSAIQVDGDLAYIVGDGRFLHVFNVSNPALPVEVSSSSAGGRAILVEDGFAYSAGKWGLAVQNVADPLQPVLMGGFPAERGSWRGLALADGLVFGAAGRGGLQIIDLGPEYARVLPVEIAIRADGESGAVNLASRGVIPVTVLGTADFDVSEIDRSTLRFGPGSATPAHKMGGHFDDVNEDGRPDLVSHYWIRDSGISEADEKACVAGQTFAGTLFEGCGTLDAMLP